MKTAQRPFSQASEALTMILIYLYAVALILMLCIEIHSRIAIRSLEQLIHTEIKQ